MSFFPTSIDDPNTIFAADEKLTLDEFLEGIRKVEEERRDDTDAKAMALFKLIDKVKNHLNFSNYDVKRLFEMSGHLTPLSLPGGYVF